MKPLRWMFVLLLAGLAACQSTRVIPTELPSSPIHAVRIDYPVLTATARMSTSEEQTLEKVGINLLAVGAGRVDWTYFPWSGHSSSWSDAVRGSGVDFLARDASRFSSWAQVSAVVDVLAPVYIQQHPEAAAISWAGVPDPELVSLTQMTSGEFSQQLLDFISAVAKKPDIRSITLVEMFYYVDGFGADDLASFRQDTGLTDWPRLDGGAIDINAPSVSQWRSRAIVSFLDQVAAIVHGQGKQLWLEVKPNEYQLQQQDWSEMNQYLSVVDRLVVFGNPIFTSSTIPAGLTVQNLDSIGQGRLIYELGLWKEGPSNNPADRTALSPVEAGTLFKNAFDAGIQQFWLTPSFNLTPGIWDLLDPYLSGSSVG